MAAESQCGAAARQRLLVFCLGAAPADRLLPLLRQWQAGDASGGDCWQCFPEEGPNSGGQQEQQQWLSEQLAAQHGSLGASADTSGGDDGSSEAVVLGCLLALGHRGLQQWEELLTAQQQGPLTHTQRRRALLLGLTAAGSELCGADPRSPGLGRSRWVPGGAASGSWAAWIADPGVGRLGRGRAEAVQGFD